MNVCKVAVIQMEVQSKRTRENCDKAESIISQAVQEGIDIAVLPECVNQGHFYSSDRNDYAETLSGYTTSRMQDVARRLNIHIAYGINEKVNGACYSSMILISPKKILGKYHKRHPAFAEKLFWLDGKDPMVIETPWGRIGLLICFDMSYPDTVIDYMGSVDMLLISSAWPIMRMGKTVAEHNVVLPRAIAMQLRAPVVYSNPVGDLAIPVPRFEGGVTYYKTSFAGSSMVCDCNGETLCHLGREEGFATAKVNLFYSRTIRQLMDREFWNPSNPALAFLSKSS